MKQPLSKRTILKLSNPKSPVIFEGKRYEIKEMDRGFVYSEELTEEAREDYKKFKSLGFSLEVIQGEY
jgi:DNA polymerase IIIc chi subunit